MLSLARALAVALIVGTIVMGVASIIHPVLQGDPESHLRSIADAVHWRTVHLTMLASTGLVMTGIWVRLFLHRGASPPLVGALAVITVGLAIHSLNIAYMTGAGWQLAQRFAAGEVAMAVVYDVTHPIGLVAARYGNFIVALGALVLGWVEWRDSATPRFMAPLAWAAGIGGLIGVIFFHESSPATLGAVAILSGWQIVTGLRVLLWHEAPA